MLGSKVALEHFRLHAAFKAHDILRRDRAPDRHGRLRARRLGLYLGLLQTSEGAMHCCDQLGKLVRSNLVAAHMPCDDSSGAVKQISGWGRGSSIKRQSSSNHVR